MYSTNTYLVNVLIKSTLFGSSNQGVAGQVIVSVENVLRKPDNEFWKRELIGKVIDEADKAVQGITVTKDNCAIVDVSLLHSALQDGFIQPETTS